MAATHGEDVGPRPRSLEDVPPNMLFATMPLSVTEVITEIARFYDLHPATMRKEDRSKPRDRKGHARMMICFFLYRLFGRQAEEKKGRISYRGIGSRLGYVDGSGPKQAARIIADRAESDQGLRDEIAMIEQRLATYLRKRGKPWIDE